MVFRNKNALSNYSIANRNNIAHSLTANREKRTLPSYNLCMEYYMYRWDGDVWKKKLLPDPKMKRKLRE